MYWLNFVILFNMKSVIKNISKLIQCDSNDIKFRAGNEMNSLETISNAFLEIEKGLITDIGDMDQWKGIDDWKYKVFIDDENDPNETGLVGSPFSLISTDEGDLDAKLTTLDPNFSAGMVELMLHMNLQKEDTVVLLAKRDQLPLVENLFRISSI